VTRSHFSKDCTTKADYERKIGQFKKFIGSELPEIWEDFFSSLLEKNPLFSTARDYEPYRVKDMPGFMRFLKEMDAESYIQKAEGRLFLVHTNMESKFIQLYEKHIDDKPKIK